MICNVFNIRILLLLLLLVSACSQNRITNNEIAEGAPGLDPVWSYAGKTGIGTSYETYSDIKDTLNVSKVWFSVANGIVTETIYGLIHEAQLKEMKFVVVGNGFVDYEDEDTESTIEYLYTDSVGRPLSLAYKIINRDKERKYTIEKHIFTDPNEQSLFVRTIFHSGEDGIIPYLYLNPHINNTGFGDKARVDEWSLTAFESGNALTLLTSKKFENSTAGFVGVTDGLTDLQNFGGLKKYYHTTGKETGNVAMLAQLKTMSGEDDIYDFVIGFGKTTEESIIAAKNTLCDGYSKVLAHYNGTDTFVGWSDYLESLSSLTSLYASSVDGGKLLNASAMVLKAQEDKTFPGALIASLSNPWGETSSAIDPSTGYKGVWPRDFYQCAMAFLALGDTLTPLVAFEYLQKVQVKSETPGNKGTTGWFLQKSHVDGELEWTSVQLDQTAMPIMLGWKLWTYGILNDEKAQYWYTTMLKPAADFLVYGGEIDIGNNQTSIHPPASQQERWEEQTGYSPSTTAAIISGLVCAADLANLSGDTLNSILYLKTADKYEQSIKKTMFTINGLYNSGAGNGKYFIRLTANNNPNDGAPLGDNNGKPGLNETLILDAGFLELVRYGVRKANDLSILESLPELDDTTREDNLRVKYFFSYHGDSTLYPGWRRYGNDGYGEDISDGSNYGKMKASQRGRVWPMLTGERGHYDLVRNIENKLEDTEKLKNTYVKAMEYFANEGLMLPEQVWDGVGVNAMGYKVGEGTNTATPLAWAHAEYIKLLRSISDNKVWDRYPNVEERYSKR